MTVDYPTDWDARRLGDFAKATGGSRFPPDAQGESDGDYPFYKVSDMNLLGNELVMRNANNWITESTRRRIKAKTHPPGAVVFPKIGAAVATNKKRLLTRESIIDNNVMAVVINDSTICIPEYLRYWFETIHLSRLSNSGALPSIPAHRVHSQSVPLPPLPEQKKIGHILSTVQRAIEAQDRIIQITTELKRALMHKLFTEGLHNEAQKQTKIGPLPKSWDTATIESVCAIRASAMTYKQLENARNVPNGIRVLAVKVSDMNLPGNEIEFRSSNLERQLSEQEVLNRTIPGDSIIFPKRGAAIATNKKRLTTGYTVLDPNLIAVVPSDTVDHRYLFHWFNTFDLRKITDPGPTPQLNKKDIAPLTFPLPSIDEQEEIAAAIDNAEEKAFLHARKCNQLQDLFRTLLQELMTARIRVASADIATV